MDTLPNDLVDKIINFTPWYTLTKNDIHDPSGVTEKFINSHFASEVRGDEIDDLNFLLNQKINDWLESLSDDGIEFWVNKIGAIKLLKEYKNTYPFVNLESLFVTTVESINGWILFCYIRNRVTFNMNNI